MPRSKADIANAAIRMFLQEVGQFYDQARGFIPYRSMAAQKEEILRFFDHRCCYCETEIGSRNMSEDHLVPINKTALGLHCWGNIVPSCKACNEAKHLKSWDAYLSLVCGGDREALTRRHQKLFDFLATYAYEPNLPLQEIANNLYQDVGEVASTLIRLRLKQAEKIIQQLQSAERST